MVESVPGQPARSTPDEVITSAGESQARVVVEGGTENGVIRATIVNPDSDAQPVEILSPAQAASVAISGEMPAENVVSEELVPVEPLARAEQTTPIRRLAVPIGRLRQLSARSFTNLPLTLFGASLIVYLVIHLVGLLNFPIYFSVDEAASTIQAADFVSNGFHDFRGELFPTFFQNGGQFCLSTSVYLQVIPYLLFGKSEWMVRFITVLVSLAAVLWMGLILRNIFKKSYWWSGVMLLGLAPAWFLSSRTGFEYTLMVTLYTGFIYYYLQYRLNNPRNLFIALVLGGLAFYAYTPAQVIMVVTGLLLLISDARYHWQNRKTGLLGLGLVALMAAPFARFLIMHPADYTDRLGLYGSYLVGNGTTLEKIGTYLSKWLTGLNPFYYFFANGQNLPLYTMKGYGVILWPMLFLAALGSWMMLRRLRKSEYRLLLLTILAAPTGAAIVAIDSNRVQVILIPIILLTCIGLEACLDWVKNKQKISETVLSLGLFVVLSVWGGLILRDALVNGPTWYTNYGLDGMQFGARQVFGAAQSYQNAHPDVQIYISPNWTFQSDVVKRFFLPDNTSIKIGTVDAFIENVKPEIDQTLFVLTPADYLKVVDSGEFKTIAPDQVIPYPDGTPGFYFARLQYRDDIQQIMAAIADKRHQLIYENILLDGQSVRVGYSKLDVGPINNAFDGDPGTLIKSSEANPLTLTLDFPQARGLSGVTVRVGSEPVKVTVYLSTSDNAQPIQFSTEVGEANGYKDIALDFGTTVITQSIKIEVTDVLVPEPTNVHVWEVTLR